MYSFNNEEGKRLSPLQIVKDSDEILRLKTKVFLRDDHKDFRLPIILPYNHPVIKALIIYKYVQLGHVGVQMLMYKLRENDVEDLEPPTPAIFLQDIREVAVPELDQIDENKFCVPNGEAGLEPRVETLELPHDSTSDDELQQPRPQRSRYGALLKLQK
ncbi:hypothetical protein TNCV_2575731 [Trichonephila clavipes]|uniref:Uncharacterized protein n=1 Tax=Trichonephila clavipes TaxID=2585209 RepID=A0A8X6RBU1_TRICX|nr:hypothetical protein TNCV_2575731 [Trichonephila clavipes]